MDKDTLIFDDEEDAIKVIAVINKPSSCANCIFHRCKWAHPFWSKTDPNTKGVYCQLDEEYPKRIKTLHVDDDVTTLGWCPLRPLQKPYKPPNEEV